MAPDSVGGEAWVWVTVEGENQAEAVRLAVPVRKLLNEAYGLKQANPRDRVKVRLRRGSEQFAFTTYAACAGFLADLLDCDDSTVCKKLRRRLSEIAGWLVEYAG